MIRFESFRNLTLILSIINIKKIKFGQVIAIQSAEYGLDITAVETVIQELPLRR